jgi:hypothetical protein
VWDQEEDINVLISTGVQELVGVMEAQAIQREQGRLRISGFHAEKHDFC